MSTLTNPRAVALDLLRQWEKGRTFADDLLHAALAKSPLAAADRKLLVELFYGVVRWRALLDRVIASRCPQQPPTGDLRNLLRLGIYQVLLLDRIPDHAAVNETVELTPGSKRSFVNAVLRRVVRETATIQLLWEKLERDDPATAFSHPEFLVQRWRRQFGLDRTLALLEWNNEPPVLFARVNELKTTREKLLEALLHARVVARESCLHPLCVEIEPTSSIDRLAAFEAGQFYVQDPSTLLAVDLLDPQPGEVILDACAAPGGKTTYIAQKMKNQGRVIAADSSEKRLQLVTDNGRRLGVSIITTYHSPPSTRQFYDRILVDAPCSNTGVLRRRVDLRWRIRAEEITRLAKAQVGILGRVAPLLKQGGRLVYSTCSLEPEENGKVVEEFLAGHPAFRLDAFRSIFPPESKTDGAYVAVLAK